MMRSELPAKLTPYSGGGGVGPALQPPHGQGALLPGRGRDAGGRSSRLAAPSARRLAQPHARGPAAGAQTALRTRSTWASLRRRFPLPISSKILCLYPRNSASGIRRSLDKEHWPPLKSCRMVADRPGNHHTDQQGMNSRNTHIHTHTNTCREFSWTLYPIQPFPLVTFLRCCRVSETDTRIGG